MTVPPAPSPVHAALALGGLFAAGVALAEETGGSSALAVPGLLALAGVVLRTLRLVPVLGAATAFLLLAPGHGLPAVRAPLRTNELLLVGGTLAHLAGLSRLANRAAADPDPSAGLPRLGATLIAALAVGQVAVWLVGRYTLDWNARGYLVSEPSRRVADLESRAFVSILLALVTVGAASFGVWYARIAGQSREQARVTLLDTAWAESRRELSRQALFRARRRARSAPRVRLSAPRVVTLAIVWTILAAGTAAAVAWVYSD